MKYLLDFDGVLFDAQLLKQKIAALGLHEAERTVLLLDRVEEAGTPVSSLVFEDARTFVAAHPDSCSIVSSCFSTNPLNNHNEERLYSFQEAKIKRSGMTDLVGDINVHIVGESKSPALAMLAQICAEQHEPCVFIDDRLQFVDEANRLGIPAVWMNRSSNTISDKKQYEISSFVNLEEKLATWTT